MRWNDWYRNTVQDSYCFCRIYFQQNVLYSKNLYTLNILSLDASNYKLNNNATGKSIVLKINKLLFTTKLTDTLNQKIISLRASDWGNSIHRKWYPFGHLLLSHRSSWPSFPQMKHILSIADKVVIRRHLRSILRLITWDTDSGLRPRRDFSSIILGSRDLHKLFRSWR